MELKRYDEPDGDHRGMERDDEDGYFVLYDDYDALLARAVEAERKLAVAVDAMRRAEASLEPVRLTRSKQMEHNKHHAVDILRFALREIGGE